jgi:hypothetical protein
VSHPGNGPAELAPVGTKHKYVTRKNPKTGTDLFSPMDDLPTINDWFAYFRQETQNIDNVNIRETN